MQPRRHEDTKKKYFFFVPSSLRGLHLREKRVGTSGLPAPSCYRCYHFAVARRKARRPTEITAKHGETAQQRRTEKRSHSTRTACKAGRGCRPANDERTSAMLNLWRVRVLVVNRPARAASRRPRRMRSSVSSPLLRSSVCIRCLRHLRDLPQFTLWRSENGIRAAKAAASAARETAASFSKSSDLSMGLALTIQRAGVSVRPACSSTGQSPPSASCSSS